MSTHHHHTHPAAHTHDAAGHSHGPADFNRAFALGIVLNTTFVAVEAFYGWQVNSLALLADAGHNLSDVAGLVLAWVDALALRLQPNARHTYGFRRASILAAFANAVLLLVAMGSLAWEALQRLGTPEATQGWTIMAVAAVGIVVNTATALLFLRGRAHDLNVRGAFLHMAADALVSLGVVIGGALYLWQGWRWLDPVLSLVIVVVIVAGSWGLLRQSLHLLFDGVPSHIDLPDLHDWLAARPGVARVNDLHVWGISTTQVALTAHLLMPQAPADDDFLRDTSAALQAQFGIDQSNPLDARLP